MQKKIILLMAAIIVIIGVGLYLFFTSSVGKDLKKTETPEVVLPPVPVAPPIERYEFQGIEYEFISVGGPVYDIITGEISEEQTRALSEKIINDILAKEPNSQEITLLFYSDLITLGEGKVDVAEITWTPEGMTVKMVNN